MAAPAAGSTGVLAARIIASPTFSIPPWDRQTGAHPSQTLLERSSRHPWHTNVPKVLAHVADPEQETRVPGDPRLLRAGSTPDLACSGGGIRISSRAGKGCPRSQGP